MRGDDQFAILFIAGETSKPSIVVPNATPIPECCFILPLFGNSDYVANPDQFKQDETSYFNYYDGSAIDTVELVIQKNVGCVWVDQETITNNDYGTFSALGTEVINGLNYISIKNINWSKVLVDFGAGVYRIQTNEESIFASEATQHSESFEYDLQEFDANKADNTVFFKIDNSGSLGDRFDATKRFAFPADWSDGMRLPGEFGFDRSDLKKEYHKFNSGKLEYTTSKRTPKFTFKGKPLSEGPRKYFENELMLADIVLVTDYNKNAANTHIDTPVHGDGEFGPAYSPNTNKAYFDIEFTSAYDNYIKKHCIN